MAQASSRKAVFWALNFGAFVGMYTFLLLVLSVKPFKRGKGDRHFLMRETQEGYS